MQPQHLKLSLCRAIGEKFLFFYLVILKGASLLKNQKQILSNQIICKVNKLIEYQTV